MSFFKTLHNNLKHDIWGNYQMCKTLGPAAGYGFLARKSWALAKAIVTNRRVTVNDRQFYDTWNG